MTEQRLTLTTIDEARERLSALDLQAALIRVEDLDLRVDDERALFVAHGGDAFRVRGRTVLGALREQTGVDGAGLGELSEDTDLVGLVVQHSLQKRKGHEVRLVTSGSEVLDVMPATYPWLPPVEAFDVVTGALESELVGVESVRAVRGHTTMRFVTGHAAEPPTRRDDSSHAGVMVRCNGQVECHAYVVRCVCSNGLLGEYTVAVHETRRTVVDSLRAQTLGALARSRKLLDDFVSLDAHPVENPATFLTQLARTRALGDRQTRRLLEALATLPARATRYDLVNMVTAQAHAKGDERFELLGTQAMDAFANDACSHCARPV